MKPPSLKRVVPLWLAFAYGLGTILGAGIYVLVGNVAGYAGVYAPLAFLLASIVAAFTALSYSELCSRYPKAAGEAVYVENAFGQRWLTGLVGWAVIATGIISAAAIARGFVGYFQFFVPAPDWVILLGFVFLLGGIAAWGILESVTLAMIITLIEVGGLILVIGVCGVAYTEVPGHFRDIGLPTGEAWLGITLGAFLAFYAYIGFEDMVNLAEEVKNPRKNLPIALILSVIVATLLYLLVSLGIVLVLPQEALRQSTAPFITLFEKRGLWPGTITLISLVAIINSALVQIIMASRVLYGMGKQQVAPKALSYVHPFTQTPLLATLLVTLCVLGLTLTLPIVTLAEVTSFIILLVFAMVNLALIVVKKKKNEGEIHFPRFVPMTGLALCLALLVGKMLLF